MLLVTSERPLYTGKIGYFVINNGIAPVATGGVIIVGIPVDYFGGSIYQDAFWQGFEFVAIPQP